MKSIGYKNLKVNSFDELEKIDKTEPTIEFLLGNMATGKTFLLNEYYKNNEKVIYIKSLLDDEDNDFININIDRIDLKNKLNDITNNQNVLIYEHNNINKLNENIDILVDFAKENNYIILLDTMKLNLVDFLNDLEGVDIVVATMNKNMIKDYSFKIPYVFTSVNYRKVEKLKGSYSGNISLRIPKTLHYDLSKEAQIEGISLNQYLLYLISSRKN